MHYFLTNFLKSNCLSYRCTRAARRSVIKPDEVERYRAELDEAYETLSWDRILNTDESFCLILYLPRKTAAPTGADTAKLEIDSVNSYGIYLSKMPTRAA